MTTQPANPPPPPPPTPPGGPTPGAVSAPPNQWAVITDFAKAIITLGSALLAITVTFGETLINSSQVPPPAWSVILLWGTLVTSILTAGIAAAFAIAYLRNGSREWGCILSCNVSLTSMCLAGCILLGLGVHRIWFARPLLDLPTANKLSLDAIVAASHQTSSVWTLEQFKWDRGPDEYDLEFVGQPSAQGSAPKYHVRIDAKTSRILECLHH